MVVSNPLAQTTVTDTSDASTPTTRRPPKAWALVLAHSVFEPHRVGQIAYLELYEPTYIGRGGKAARKYGGFAFLRPGVPHVVARGEEFLAGDKVSRAHIECEANPDGVTLTKLTRAKTLVGSRRARSRRGRSRQRAAEHRPEHTAKPPPKRAGQCSVDGPRAQVDPVGHEGGAAGGAPSDRREQEGGRAGARDRADGLV